MSSVYHYQTIDKLKRAQTTKFERAVFTQPRDPITCPGAPQKIVYCTTDHWKSKGFNPNVKFFQGNPFLFAVPFYS